MRMELALPERFDTRQALRYLGISTEEPDSATRALLRRAERTLRAAAGPRAVAVRAARDDISPYLLGNDILRHLEGCGSCVLLACTLGAGVDAALRAAGASDMAYAVVLDALASVAVEQTADALKWFKKEVKKAGFPGLELQFAMWSINLNYSGFDGGKTENPENDFIRTLGFTGTTHYQFAHFANVDQDYLTILEQVRDEWARIDTTYDFHLLPAYQRRLGQQSPHGAQRRGEEQHAGKFCQGAPHGT